MDYDKIGRLFVELVRVIKKLRTPETGCPWDLEQDHKSLRPYLIEEAYEVLQALDSGDDAKFCDELGDLLLQVVLHAQVAGDRGAFSISDIVEAITEKMIRRHPHVFSDVKVTGSEEVLRNWERQKQREDHGKDERSPTARSFASIPASMPALLRAQRIGEKAAKVSFDWSSAAEVFEKVKEEAEELRAELEAPTADKQAIEHELGDLLFSLCQLARWTGLSAEDTLRAASTRFIDRFSKMEKLAGPKFPELSTAQLEALWQRAKTSEK